MAIFIYEAYDHTGAITHGEYEAIKREEVVQYLLKRKLTPVSIEDIGTQNKKVLDISLTFFERITPVDVLFLVRNLATMIKAGLPVVEALDILIADAEKSILKKMFQHVQVVVRGGQTLSSGFSAYANAFPPIFLGMLQAGEVSGQLDRTLAELGQYLSKEYALRSKVKSALMYPAILLIAATIVVALLLIFVLPRLTKAFAASGVELPLITKIFLGLSNALTWSYLLDLFVLAGLTWFFVYFRATRTGKKFIFWLLSFIPVANDLIKKVALVRFTRTFGSLMDGGLSAVESLELSSRTIGNDRYEHALKTSMLEIKNGVPISEALGRYPHLFPRLLISLIVVGERTGSLSAILITFSDFYEEEVDNKLKNLTAILEPGLLLIMGLLVGAIAFSILMPIYQLVGHFT